MCTVIEESNEDDFEDSPEKKGQSLSKKDRDINDESVKSSPVVSPMIHQSTVSSLATNNPQTNPEEIASKQPLS